MEQPIPSYVNNGLMSGRSSHELISMNIMAPTAVDEPHGAVASLKNQEQAIAGSENHVIDPEVRTRPNLALWVSKDHQ
jgi:hypothetical protein